MTAVKTLFILTIAAILTIIAVSFWLYTSLTATHEHDKKNQFIVIEKGSAPGAIIDKLAEDGVIASPLATKIYLRTLGDAGKLQAGEYQFDSPISPLQVLRNWRR
jgi:UPF0755 protein